MLLWFSFFDNFPIKIQGQSLVFWSQRRCECSGVQFQRIYDRLDHWIVPLSVRMIMDVAHLSLCDHANFFDLHCMMHYDASHLTGIWVPDTLHCVLLTHQMFRGHSYFDASVSMNHFS